MNFRASAQMLVLFPKRIMATYVDLTMPKRDWSKLDAPAVERHPANVAALRIERARHERRPAAR